jgi:hypothetical protein
MPEYDDEAEVTRFVWDHYQHLMTDFERRVGSAIIGRLKAASASPQLAARLNEQWGGVGDPEIEAALAEGSEAFRRRVCRRLLREVGAGLVLNRCPRCRSVTRTPKARPCFWCGHDWH